MTGLAGYDPPQRKVVIKTRDGETEVIVRGLTVNSIAALINAQGDIMRDLYDKAIKGEFQAADIETLLDHLLAEAPLVAALTIAFGCNEPDEWQKCMDMPFADQAVLLEAIIEQTVEREGGAKKVGEIVKRAIASAARVAPRQAA